MATRARIGVLHPDGSVTSIYSHWDGYPSVVGNILAENYSSEDLASQLVRMGGVFALEGTIEESIFYHRHRDEDLQIAESFNQMAFVQLARGCGAEWAYLWEDGRWRTYRIGV